MWMRRVACSMTKCAYSRCQADCEGTARLSRLRAAIEAGADPAALVESVNAAQEQRAAAQAEFRVLKPEPARLTDANVYAMVDDLGDVGASLPGRTRTECARSTTTCAWR
jgi:hypothetical protein